LDSLDKLLQEAEAENIRLRIQIVNLQNTVDKLQKIISDDMAARMETRRGQSEANKEDNELFSMMKDHTPCAPGVRQVIK